MKTNPWFVLPEEDERVLRQLIDRHGTARVLAVFSRLQLERDKQAREDAAVVRPPKLEDLGI